MADYDHKLSEEVSDFRKKSVKEIKKQSDIKQDFGTKQEYIEGNIDKDIRYFDSEACNLQLKNVIVEKYNKVKGMRTAGPGAQPGAKQEAAQRRALGAGVTLMLDRLKQHFTQEVRKRTRQKQAGQMLAMLGETKDSIRKTQERIKKHEEELRLYQARYDRLLDADKFKQLLGVEERPHPKKCEMRTNSEVYLKV